MAASQLMKIKGLRVHVTEIRVVDPKSKLNERIT
jgi:hypothetical protein